MYGKVCFFLRLYVLHHHQNSRLKHSLRSWGNHDVWLDVRVGKLLGKSLRGKSLRTRSPVLPLFLLARLLDLGAFSPSAHASVLVELGECFPKVAWSPSQHCAHARVVKHTGHFTSLRTPFPRFRVHVGGFLWCSARSVFIKSNPFSTDPFSTKRVHRAHGRPRV